MYEINQKFYFNMSEERFIMRKKKIYVILTLGICIIAVFSRIGIKKEEKVIPFIHGTTFDPSGFDPLGVSDTTSGLIVLNTLEGLFTFDWTSTQSDVIPMLADDAGSWNEDLTEWTIPLRDDVKWWDGSKFTAEDVVWNFERLNTLSQAGLCDHTNLWFNNDGDLILKSIEATKTHEIKMTLNKAWLDWKKLISFWGASMIKPVEGYEDKIIALDEYEKVIGTGPFIIDSFTAGETTVLKRYDDYWQGVASINELVIQIFADTTTMANALLYEEIHTVQKIPFDKWTEAENNANIGVEVIEGSCIYFFHMSEKVDYDVRKAMQYAFNYIYPEQEYFRGIGTQTTHPIPMGMEGYNGDLAGLPYYDLDLARNYILNSEDDDIEAAIIANGLDDESTTIEWRAAAEGDNPIGHYNFTSYGTGLYIQLADNAKDIGVLIDHDATGWPEFLDYADDHAGEMDFTYGGWCPDYYDPVNMLEPLFAKGARSNWNGLANATIDVNLAALHILSGEEKLEKVDEVVTQIIVEQAHAMYYIQSADLFAWNSDLISDGINGFFNIRNDKYFYGLEIFLGFPPTSPCPGFPVAIMLIGVLGISAFLVMKNRK